MAEDVSGSMSVNTSGAQASVGALQHEFNRLFASMNDSSLGNMIQNFDIIKMTIDKVVDVTKQMISESRELIAISTRYDVPISKMGQLQGVATMTGQSIGQVARNLRFFENNISKALLKPDSEQGRFFKQLGIDGQKLEEISKDTIQAATLVADTLKGVGEEERRNALYAEIFGANWALMLPMLEASKTQMGDMAASGYQYSESITKSLATIEQSGDLINQNIKPLGAFFGNIFAMLVTGIAAAVLGVMTLGKILKDAIGGRIQAIMSEWRQFLAYLNLGKGVIKQVATFGQSGGDDVKKAMEDIEKEQKTRKGIKYFDEKAFEKAARQGEILQDRFAQTGYGAMEAVGVVEENALAKQTLEEIEKRKAKIKELQAEYGDLRKVAEKTSEDEKKGYITAEQKKEVLERVYAQQQEISESIQDENDDLASLQRRYDRVALINKEIAKDKNFKPMTAEESKIGLQRTTQENERAVKEAMAKTPIGQQQETYYAIYEARLNQLKVEKDIAAYQAANRYDPQKQADMENQLANAKIKVMEAERAHENFLQKMQRERIDSERDRREIMVKAMGEREKVFMARQGMTGIDQQTTIFSNAVEKLQRDQERLKEYEADPKRTQEQKLAARKDVEASAIAAQKELDKTTLMQFQYGASDAAKKGMGGGIDIRENQLQISKDQLDILRKQLDLMYRQFNINPLDYGNVPMVMQGAQRMK